MDTQQEFWFEVREERDRLSVALEKEELDGQPYKFDAKKRRKDARGVITDTNPVYLTSLRHREKGTAAGVVTLMPIFLAGQRITEQTHRVSTPAEIEELLEYQEAERRRIHQVEVRKNLTHTQVVRETAAGLIADTNNFDQSLKR